MVVDSENSICLKENISVNEYMDLFSPSLSQAHIHEFYLNHYEFNFTQL